MTPLCPGSRLRAWRRRTCCSFTVYDLRKVHEAVLGRKLDKDLFRRHSG